jgi:hypothetical protein
MTDLEAPEDPEEAPEAPEVTGPTGEAKQLTAMRKLHLSSVAGLVRYAISKWLDRGLMHQNRSLRTSFAGLCSS